MNDQSDRGVGVGGSVDVSGVAPRKRAKRRTAEEMADDEIKRREEELAAARAAKAALVSVREDDEALASASATLGQALLDQCADRDNEALAVLKRAAVRSPKTAPIVARVQAILDKRARNDGSVDRSDRERGT